MESSPFLLKDEGEHMPELNAAENISSISSSNKHEQKQSNDLFSILSLNVNNIVSQGMCEETM